MADEKKVEVVRSTWLRGLKPLWIALLAVALLIVLVYAIAGAVVLVKDSTSSGRVDLAAQCPCGVAADDGRKLTCQPCCSKPTP